MTRATPPQWSFADLEFRAQNITLDPLLQQISDFIDQHQTLVEHVRRDLQRGLKNPATGRNGLDAPQVLRSLTLMRVKNWDYRELRERIADGYTLRQFTQFFSCPVPKHDAFHRAFVRLTPATLETVNQLVVEAAVPLGLEDGKKLRTDTTVVEADIHHPTDSTLLWDTVRVLSRLVGRLDKLLPFVADLLAQPVQGCIHRLLADPLVGFPHGLDQTLAGRQLPVVFRQELHDAELLRGNLDGLSPHDHLAGGLEQEQAVVGRHGAAAGPEREHGVRRDPLTAPLRHGVGREPPRPAVDPAGRVES